jgi:hypothetical protein
MVTGYRRQLTFDDVWELRPCDRCDEVMPKFEAEWSKELQKHNRRFAAATLFNHIWNHICTSMLNFIYSVPEYNLCLTSFCVPRMAVGWKSGLLSMNHIHFFKKFPKS